jgi:hypothetical protein
MGYSICWLAFHGCSKEQALEATQLQETGEPDEANESPQSGASFPNDWYVIFLNQHDHPLALDDSLSQLSHTCQIVACHIEEHVMYSSCCEYRDGKELWSVSHNAQKDLWDLKADGEIPDWFADIKNEAWKQQEIENAQSAEVDFIFDVPLLMAEKICGHKHDRWKYDWGEPTFTVLSGTTPRQSFLARLLRPLR